MSDLLIKNMEMPKNGDSTVIAIYYDGVWCNYTDNEPNGKAVALPPHGRLIDADILRMKYEYGDERKKVDESPTVLEASNG